MKKTLVNHSGHIQYKYIIRNEEDIVEYSKINSNQHIQYFQEMLLEKVMTENISRIENKHHQIITMHAEKHNISVLESCSNIAHEKIQKLLKHVLNGNVIVINQAGGYCFWDDSEMEELEENENVAKRTEISNIVGEPIIDIIHSDFLILENQSRITEGLDKYIKNYLKTEAYSSMLNMQFASEELVRDSISKAILDGCSCIVAETTLSDEEQIKNLVEIFDKLPSMEFHIITSENLQKKLIDAVGEEKAMTLYEKHKIVTVQF